jgi:hypothetical protein
MLPMHKILAHCVTPVHRAPYVAVGIMLVKKVVFSAQIHQAVGIVHPMTGRGEMKLRSVLLLIIIASLAGRQDQDCEEKWKEINS